jgi:cobalt/nickel transport system permease protein
MLRRGDFLAGSLAAIGQALEGTLFAEDIGRRPGLLQGLDPRVKIGTFLLLLIAVNLCRSLTVLASLYLLTLLLAWSSRVPLGFFVRRVWIFIPLFAGVIALPAILNIFTPGQPVLVLWPSPLIAVTAQGLRTAAFLLLRVGTSVSFAVLLILTTPWSGLLEALGALGVPEVFLLTLAMSYRYIYLLLHTASDMFLSRRSRLVGRLDAAEGRRWLAAAMGALLERSFLLSNEVYLAMLSQGFRGRPRLIEGFRTRARDWLWGGVSLFVALGAIYMGS